MTHRTYLIAKAERRLKDSGLPEIAAGTAVAAGAVPAIHHSETRHRRNVVSHAEAKRDAHVSYAEHVIAREKAKQIPKTSPKKPAQLVRLKGANKLANTARAEAKETIATRGKVKFHPRMRNWVAAGAAGGALALTGAHRSDKARAKREGTSNDHRTAAGVLGAAAGPTALHNAAIAAKKPMKRAQVKIDADPELKRQLNAHRAKHLPKNAPMGHPGWRSFNREYPKNLPGAGAKRFVANVASGKRGMLVHGAVGAATGLAAMKGAQRKDRRTS